LTKINEKSRAPRYLFATGCFGNGAEPYGRLCIPYWLCKGATAGFGGCNTLRKGIILVAIQEHAEPRGLGEAVADARLADEGPNELPQGDRRTVFRIVLEVLREPMLALLIGGGIV